MFDRFFDCLNTRRAKEGRKQGNKTLNHTEVLMMSDLRCVNFKIMYVIISHLQWLENDFLGYLAEWDEMVQFRENFIATEKRK